MGERVEMNSEIAFFTKLKIDYHMQGKEEIADLIDETLKELRNYGSSGCAPRKKTTIKFA